MLELLTKLIDRFIQLEKQRNEQNRNLFVDFVEPLIAAFKALHADYLHSFEKYREDIMKAKTCKEVIEDLFEEIDRDAVFSATNRIDLWSMRSLREDPVLSELVDCVFEYLDYALLNMYDLELVPSNEIRRGFKMRLAAEIPNDNDLEGFEKWRKSALKVTKNTVQVLHLNYSRTIGVSQKVKEKLLLK